MTVTASTGSAPVSATSEVTVCMRRAGCGGGPPAAGSRLHNVTDGEPPGPTSAGAEPPGRVTIGRGPSATFANTPAAGASSGTVNE